MHAGAISKLVYVFASVRAIIHSLKLVDYFLVQAHKPYTNLRFSWYIEGQYIAKSIDTSINFHVLLKGINMAPGFLERRFLCIKVCGFALLIWSHFLKYPMKMQ